MESTAPVAPIDTSTMDVIAGGFCVLVLIALIVGLYFWLPKLLSFGQETGASEERFLHETIRELTGEAPTASSAGPPPPARRPAGPEGFGESAPSQPPPLPTEDRSPALPPPPPPFHASSMPASAPPLGVAESEALQRLADRLSQLGIVEAFEGRIPLAMPPTGLIYRLKRGGSCAVLPRMEHPDVMEHLARRFDMLFVLQSGENVLVVERLATRAKDFLQMGPGSHG